MTSDAPTPLFEASIEDLIGELQRRTDAGIVIIFADVSRTEDAIGLRTWGSLPTQIGLSAYVGEGIRSALVNAVRRNTEEEPSE